MSLEICRFTCILCPSCVRILKTLEFVVAIVTRSNIIVVGAGVGEPMADSTMIYY